MLRTAGSLVLGKVLSFVQIPQHAAEVAAAAGRTRVSDSGALTSRTANPSRG